jgi:recombination protein RecT
MNEEKSLVKKQDLKTLLASDAVRQRFNDVLGRNSGAFVAAVLNAAVLNPEIQQCDPISVINAALQAAVIDLSISPALGQAAIIPFNSKDGKKAQFQIMKNGIIQLALRTNQYRYIHISKVYEGERWEEDRLTGMMRLEGNRTSPKVIGIVGYFRLLNGFEKYLVMSIDEIMDHASRFSKSWDKANQCFYKGSAWSTSFDRMCEKTVLKLLLKNYGVLSDKMQRAFEIENETGEVAPESEPAETFDTEILDATEPETPAQPKRTIAENLNQLGFDDVEEAEAELNYSGA